MDVHRGRKAGGSSGRVVPGDAAASTKPPEARVPSEEARVWVHRFGSWLQGEPCATVRAQIEAGRAALVDGGTAAGRASLETAYGEMAQDVMPRRRLGEGEEVGFVRRQDVVSPAAAKCLLDRASVAYLREKRDLASALAKEGAITEVQKGAFLEATIALHLQYGAAVRELRSLGRL